MQALTDSLMMDYAVPWLLARCSVALARVRADISLAHLQVTAWLLLLVVTVLASNVSAASATAILMPSGVALAMRDRARCARSRQMLAWTYHVV